MKLNRKISKSASKETESSYERQGKIYKMMTDKIIAAMAQGKIPWQRPWRFSGIQRSILGHVYQGANQILLQLDADMNGYVSPFWITDAKVRENNYTVKTGQHPTEIIFSKRVSFTEKQKAGEEKQEGKSRTFYQLRYFRVYNTEQIKDPIKTPQVPVYDEIEPMDACEQIIKNMPHRPTIKHGGDRAFYATLNDFVQLPHMKNFKSQAGYYSVAFHELGHSTGHASRLARFEAGHDHTFGSGDYSKEELVAELTASFLCGSAGIDVTVENNAAYLQSWMKALSDEPRWFISAASEAQKAANYIQGIKEISYE